MPTGKVDHYGNLNTRCNDLILKYLEPIIAQEKDAANNSNQIPLPDFDNLAAFRLLTHAELEGYFESKAEAALDHLESQFIQSRVSTSKFAALIFLYMQKKQIFHEWSTKNKTDDQSIRKAEQSDLMNLSQAALGFGRQFIKSNNGIKLNSILTLSALMGYFEDELDDILVRELNEYGKARGDVAHDSWTKDTRTFTSADIEKEKLLNILKLTFDFYEQVNVGNPNQTLTIKQKIGRWFAKIKSLQ